MQRRTNPLPARIWTYGCLEPTLNKDVVHDQLQRAHRYYNALIEIERGRRVAFREERSKLVELAPLEEKVAGLADALEKARAALKATRQKSRARKEAQPSEAKAIKGLAQALRDARMELRAARAAVKGDERLAAAVDRINAETTERIKAARATSGLYLGTYLLVEQAVEAARKSKIDPGFRRWTGEGRVGVQLHHEHMHATVLGSQPARTLKVLETGERVGTRSTLLQIDPLPADTWTKKEIVLPDGSTRLSNRKGRRNAYTKVRVRVGSTATREPVWAELPMVFHRPPPADAAATWAWIRVTRVGPDTRYELQVVLESKTFETVVPATAKNKTMALDVGWRVKRDGSLRVAYGVGSDGRHVELVLPERVRSALAFCDRLRSYQDLHFNAARAVLVEWLKANPSSGPDWMREDAKHAHLWRSPAKLARLAAKLADETWNVGQHAGELEIRWDAWMKSRLENKLDLFDTYETIVGECALMKSKQQQLALYLEWWRRKNRHLYAWQAHQRDKSLARRKDIYRNFAADLAREYEFIVVEEFDLRKFMRNAAPEDATQDHLHRLMRDASPGQARLLLTSAAGKERVFGESAIDSTRECHDCGHVNDAWEKPEELVQICAGCKREFDQDENAAKNLLKRWSGGGGSKKPGSAGKKPPAAKGGKRKGAASAAA